MDKGPPQKLVKGRKRDTDAGCGSSTWEQQDGGGSLRQTDESDMVPGLGPPGPDGPRSD